MNVARCKKAEKQSGFSLLCMSSNSIKRIKKPRRSGVFLVYGKPQLGWGFRKAFSFKPVIKTPFDLLKHLAVWQLQKFNKKSKGG
ncbi:hypothetical protein, partial [Salmonella sp. XN2]|uniref:hypothetical protein n=1 Tax=Salmonella sp. XN2 TaxID=2665223 RepID=UPI001F47B52D